MTTACTEEARAAATHGEMRTRRSVGDAAEQGDEQSGAAASVRINAGGWIARRGLMVVPAVINLIN